MSAIWTISPAADRFAQAVCGQRSREESPERRIGLRARWRESHQMQRRRRPRLYTAVDRPSTIRFDRSAIASNTGCTSSGELAITFRMSAVAVCRSSASCVSLNSRTFSIAITA